METETEAVCIWLLSEPMELESLLPSFLTTVNDVTTVSSDVEREGIMTYTYHYYGNCILETGLSTRTLNAA